MRDSETPCNVIVNSWILFTVGFATFHGYATSPSPNISNLIYLSSCPSIIHYSLLIVVIRLPSRRGGILFIAYPRSWSSIMYFFSFGRYVQHLLDCNSSLAHVQNAVLSPNVCRVARPVFRLYLTGQCFCQLNRNSCFL